MRVAVLFTAAVILLGTGLASAQEDSQIPKDVLKHFRTMIGNWKTEGRIGDTEIEGTWSARWSKGKNCLIRESSYSRDGETMYGTGVIGWDPAKKRMAEYIFWTNNESYTILWELQPSGDLVGALSGFDDGQEMKAKSKVVKKGSDQFVYESTNAAGEQIEVVFRKVPRGKGKKGKKKGG